MCIRNHGNAKNAIYFSLKFFHDKNKSGPKFRCNSFFFIFNERSGCETKMQAYRWSVS